MAYYQGYYVDRLVTTLPRLTKETKIAALENMPVRKNRISVKHEGLKKTIFTNQSGPSLIWKAQLPGIYENLLVNEKPVEATKEKLFATDLNVSWVRVTVGAGETITVEGTK